MRNLFITSASRTAVGSLNKSLKNVSGHELGSAVINEMFAEDINDLSNFKYEVLGSISEPKLKRVK